MKLSKIPWWVWLLVPAAYVAGCGWLGNRIGQRGQSLDQYPQWFQALVRPGIMAATVVMLVYVTSIAPR